MAGKPLAFRMSRRTTPPLRGLGASVLLLIVLLAAAALLPFVLSQPAKAAQFSLTLYVNALGWSFTSGGEARPGPILLAVQGDQVDVTMTSEDLLPHGFFIDYNGNGVADSGDFVSPQTSGTIQFSIPADTLGTYTYGDQVVTLNTGTWVTRVNSPPQASFHAPTAATSWTGGKTHDISFDVTDPDGDPVQVSVSYSFGGGASQAIKSFAAGPTNPQIVPWTPSGFSSTDTVIRVVVQDSRGASQPFDSPAFTVDSAVPAILSYSPAAGASQVDRNSLIQVNWSEPMNKATTAAAFGVKGAGGPWVAGTTTWSTDATQLTFRPGGSLAVGTQYEVHVNATSSDASDPGNVIGHDSIWTFSTGALTDRTPPQIRSLSANPSAQIANGFVNVTADVDDTGGIATVTAAIQGPGVNQNLSLTHASGARWYLNRAYSAVGHYNITLWATDMSGNVASNETGIDIVPNGAGGIPAPQSVTVSLNDGLVDVTWSPVAWPNLAGYYVYRGNRSTPPFERLTSIPLSASAPTQYRDTTAKTGQTYYYTVTAVNTTGGESGYGPIYSVTIPPYQTPPLFDPVPWAVAGVTLGVILGALYGMVWRRRPT